MSEPLRKEGDSNPRYGNPYGSLANCWFQPLTHPSGFHLAANRGVISLIAGAKVHRIFESSKSFGIFFQKKYDFGGKSHPTYYIIKRQGGF